MTIRRFEELYRQAKYIAQKTTAFKKYLEGLK